MEQPIINRVANSSLITFDLENYFHQGERIEFDIKYWLHEEIILKEKDFRARIKDYDWAALQNKNVALFCSVDAIIPTWAYMLLAIKMSIYVNKVVMGDVRILNQVLFIDALDKVDWEYYRDAKVVVKGCGDLDVPEAAYVEVVTRLTPFAKSIMYGEPCSTVPLYKAQKK